MLHTYCYTKYYERKGRQIHIYEGAPPADVPGRAGDTAAFADSAVSWAALGDEYRGASSVSRATYFCWIHCPDHRLAGATNYQYHAVVSSKALRYPAVSP